MFFVLSKLLAFLIKPSVWVLALLLYALFGRRAHRRRALVAATGLFLFFSNHFLYNLIIRTYEPEVVTLDELDGTYDIGILLGGYSYFFPVQSGDRYAFNHSANRLTETLELYHTGRIRKILLSGGSGRILTQERSEALEVAELLKRWRVPARDILIEPDSRNTRENAVYSQQLVAETQPGARCLLITSAWHMPRAAACFRAVGMPVTPFPVDYRSERIRAHPESWLLPDARGFDHWEKLIKEWVGYGVYWLRGYA